MKRALLILLSVMMLFGLTACGGAEPQVSDVAPQTTTTAEPSIDSIIKKAELQYPASNDQFKYNVYDTYVEITEYIGSATADKVVVPHTLDNLPVYVVGRDTFGSSCKIKSVVFEDGIHKLSCEFGMNTTLQSATLPATVEFVHGVFRNCYGLKSVVIPEGVGYLMGTFEHCHALKEVKLPSTLVSIGSNTFAYCKELSSVVISEGLTSIGTEAFAGCKALKTLVLPKSLTKLDEDVFLSSGLQTIELPESVTSVGAGLFSGCSNLTSVKVYNAEMAIKPKSGFSVAILFSGCPDSLVVHGKAGSTIAKQCGQEKILFKLME